MMGGRFGKYGDLKRRRALQRSRKEKYRLERAVVNSCRSRISSLTTTPKAAPVVSSKTHKTAVVAIPPESVWAPIQGLRKQYDRHYRRWMPHITLIYPFRPLPAVERIIPRLTDVCRGFEPFEIRLNRFDFFVHSHKKATLYLVPEPASAIKILHETLLEIVPDCDDAARFAGGFTPHLSVGQVRSQKAAQEFCSRWQAGWHPLSFTLATINVIRRNDPPDDIFRSGPVLPFGRQSGKR